MSEPVKPPTFKKINRKFTLSDSRLNVYGFKLKTEGYQLSEFLKSPIGYYMHKDDDGVLLRWDDVKIEGDKVTGYPVVNLSHPRGEQTVNEIEAGFLNAASVGDIVVLEHEYEDNPSDPDNPIFVGTKWYNKETSIVEKPGNRGAFADPVKLFDREGQPINLSDLTNNYLKNNMKKITLSITPELVGMLGLADSDDEKDIVAKIKNLSDKAKNADTLKLQNDTLTKDKEKAVQDLSDLKKKTQETTVKDLLDKALDEKRITKELGDTLSADYAENPDGLKKILNTMPAYASLSDKLKEDKEIPEKFKGKKLMDLFNDNLLEEVKSDYPNLYDQLKKEHDELKKK